MISIRVSLYSYVPNPKYS